MKKIISLLLALAIPLYALPLAAGAAGSKATVTTEAEFKAALTNESVSEIEINGSIRVNDEADSQSTPLIINRAVTISGINNSSLTFWAGGIVLGADVTFKNLSFTFPNVERPAFLANGYALTLHGITISSGAKAVPIFCGSLTNPNGTFTLPDSGVHGRIIMQDCTGFGNIYAGNLSDSEANSSSALPATVTIESGSANSATGMYACGASRDNWNVPSSELYPVTGDVTFNLYYNTVSNVDGDMGGGKKAAVQYVCGVYSNSNLMLKNIASLALAQNGTDTGTLQPAAGSDLSGANLSVPADTTLNVASLTTNPTVNNFAGGGTLVLGEKQQLTINGTVSGETKVGIGSVFNNASSGSVSVNQLLISAPKSTSTSFSFLPKSTADQLKLTIQNDGSGNWKVVDPSAGAEQKILVKSLAANTPKVNDNKTEVEIPYDVEFGEDSASISSLSFIRLTVLINSKDAQYVQNNEPDENDYYTWNDSGSKFIFEVYDDSFIFRMENSVTPIPAGTYNFTISVPTANCAAGVKPKAQFTVTIPTDGETPTPTPTPTPAPTPSPSPSPEPGKPTSIAIPVAKTGLKYTGKELTGVEAGTGYTLVGNTATEIGEYTATAALQDTKKFQWADGTTDAKQIKWSIGKGAAPAAPTGLKATSPTKKDGRDGQISGTTDKMEYATNSGFTNAKDCTGNTITGLPAGTYYVRVKETNKFEAGSYAVVKVLAFGEVEEVPVPPVEVKIPVSGEEKTVEVVASIKDSTAVVSAIDTTQLGSVIGDKVNTGMVRIDFSGLEQEIDTVELPGAAVGEIAAAAQAQGNDVEGLSLKLSTGSVSFDAAALASIQKQAGSKVTLKILAKDRHDLTPEQLESIGTAPAFDLSLQGNAAITDFGKGKATVSLPYTLKPGQSAAGITIYYLDEKGKASACPTRYSQVEKAATYTTSHFSLYFVGFDSAIQWKNPFNDVRKGDWFYGAVEFAELNGLMQGDSKTVFSPNQKLSRAQLAQILYNKEGKPWVRGGSSFTDVPAKEWYANAVNWAAQKGYVMGYDSTHFGPNNSITREQLATILWRYAGEPKGKKNALSPFTDAGKASEYALPALRWAVQNEIIRGKGNNRLDPTGTATRAEVAQMLMNFLA